MAGERNVTLTIDLNDSDLSAEETDEAVQNLLAQMRELDEIEFDYAYEKAQAFLKGS
ncbi:MAG: hypothetical protein KME42_28035 [Tildeniella nuda ZEHNDER 1965/U140]|jgi:hypothetical protein|nr:hypothetical protein [Tildeniella nuda ZEHNDER 1965/U140]